MVKIVLTKFGSIEDRDIEFVRNTLEGFYRQLRPHEVAYVDLYLFESTAQMLAFFSRERLDLGIAGGAFNELFVAQHDAWRGTPRISVCLERLRALPDEVQVGSIGHEVGHSILHGSIEYYVISPLLLPALGDKKLSGQFAADFPYLVSIAVKDFEVTRFLIKRGYLRDQIAYVTSIIGTTEDERFVWHVSRNNRAAEILCIASRFKDICCAAPILTNRRFGGEFEERIAENLGYLGSGVVKKLLRIAKYDLPKLGEDTMENINVLSGLLLDTFLRA